MAACRMNHNSDQHISVMLNEVIQHLCSDPDGIYIDATYGRGGHSCAILKHLSPKGRLIAIDKDLAALDHAKSAIQDTRFSIVHASFSALQNIVASQHAMGEISGILFDLGVSSPQLDEAERGFSFQRDGKLDMRMDTTTGEDASQWIAHVPEEALANVLYQFGEEKFSRRIAKAIVQRRAELPFVTTKDLAEVIAAAIPRWEKHKHPATRSFLAIRIAINNELDDLKQALDQSIDALKLGGKLAVISFHSIEDRIVKQFIRQHEKGEADNSPRGLPIKQVKFNPKLKSVTKALKPSEEELTLNNRSRSAILRIAEKIS